MRHIDSPEPDQREIAAKKFRDFGPLGVTSDDHRAIGSTPPTQLDLQQGKTLADIMSEEDIREFIEQQKIAVKNLIDLYRVSSDDEYRRESIRRNIIEGKALFYTSLQYLRSLGKIPLQYHTYDLTKDREIAFDGG